MVAPECARKTGCKHSACAELAGFLFNLPFQGEMKAGNAIDLFDGEEPGGRGF
jgi:hypothetical protein